MTAQTTDFSGLLFYNPAGPGFDAVASATITGPNSMDEGATEIWELVTWAIPDGDIYYKIVPDGDNLNAGRFTGGLTGILTVTNNRTSIGITVSEDNATSITGQSFDIRFSKTLNGTPFATKYGVNVNDTSQGSATYEIIPSATSMSEGGTGITFTINTTNLSDGSQVIWWIDGIGSVNDPAWTTRFVEGVNNGTVTITSNTASFTLTAATNANVDDGAIFSIYIAGTLFQGVANSGNITITDATSAPTPTYALAKAGNVSSINEGAALTFNVTTTNVANGTTLYFYVGSTGASEITAGRFSQGSGSSFTVNNNTGTFDITVSADSTTAIDTQSYNVQLSTTFSPPTFVGSAVGVTVNDTSQTPPPSPVSFLFNGSNQYIEVQGSTTNWDMANGCVEFWSKATAASTGPRAVMTQQPSVGIDIFYEGGKLKVPNTTSGYLEWTEPTPGVWTHVAIINLGGPIYVFYNGVYQGNQTGQAWANSSATLYIGRRQGNFQYFDGKLYGIRISQNATYINDPLTPANFNPYSSALPPGTSLGTVLLMNPTDQVPLLDLSDSHHTLNASVGNAADQPASTGAHTLTVTNTNNGTSPGGGYFTTANCPGLASVPVGATVTGTVFANPNSSATLKVSRVWPFGGGGSIWEISYDALPGTRATVPGDTFTFTW